MKTITKKPLGFGLVMTFALMLVLMFAPITAMAAEVDESSALTVVDGEAVVEANELAATTVVDEATALLLRSIFSVQYYANNNPDVVAVLGYDEGALFDHFCTFGVQEGRQHLSPIVDLKAYRDANPDLLDKYGNDWLGLLVQFADEGIYEVADGKRESTGVLFNPVIYLREHPEAVALTGGDLLKVAELFISEGMPAGEWVEAQATVADDTDTDTATTTTADITVGSTESAVVDENVTEDVQIPDVSGGTGEDTSSGGGNSSSGGGSTEQQPEKPKCPINHFCGLGTCKACGETFNHVMDEDKGVCSICGLPRAQITCNHNIQAGSCIICGYADPTACGPNHGNYHVDEICPGCNQFGSLLYEEGGCPKAGSHGNLYTDESCDSCGVQGSKERPPAYENKPEDCEAAGGHDYVDGICSKCGSQEPEVAQVATLVALDTVEVADAADVADEEVTESEVEAEEAADEDAIIDDGEGGDTDVADTEELLEEDAIDEDVADADESVAEENGDAIVIVDGDGVGSDVEVDSVGTPAGGGEPAVVVEFAVDQAA